MLTIIALINIVLVLPWIYLMIHYVTYAEQFRLGIPAQGVYVGVPVLLCWIGWSQFTHEQLLWWSLIAPGSVALLFLSNLISLLRDMLPPDKDKLLRFKSHNLRIYVFSAGDAHINYAGSHDLFLNEVSIAKPAQFDESNPKGRSGPYPAFAGPLSVRWRSLDRTEHACELDLAELMPEPKISLPANMDDINWRNPFWHKSPTLIIEIDDRKLSL